jgi:cytochrome c553
MEYLIRNLDKQVESGIMKLVNEKHALQEIQHLYKAVENFKANSNTIEVDHAVVKELKKQLDDPKVKAISKYYDAIKVKLDEIKKEDNELHADCSKLFDK